MMNKARYIRISTADQKLERQLAKKHDDEQLYIDLISGSVPFESRVEARRLLSDVRDNKINYLTVHAVDRLGRNLIDILTTLQMLDDNGVIVKIENLGIESRIKDKPNPAFKLIISTLGNIAEMERETMLERQREGIEIAKAKGNYKGRVRGTKESDKEFLGRYKNVVKELNNGLSIRKTAKLCDVSMGTVQKVKKFIE